jgi:hypothetical protein
VGDTRRKQNPAQIEINLPKLLTMKKNNKM